ncbi:hypothetical protein WJX84_008603 [Apatococcus fuscideae]|uniref:Uncharacterized protein n=1 Tax=Apatococcus fuscideae TaxID=2026836 RepID=A0AAW1SXD7_9CHLO
MTTRQCFLESPRIQTGMQDDHKICVPPQAQLSVLGACIPARLCACTGVLVLSEFAGAAQSLGAGAILVNPWNVTDMANAIEHALTMSNEERRERHRQNYHHVTHHTVQTWADVFITELNDTHVEAELRTKHIPPPLNIDQVVRDYDSSRRRLLVLGYNATLTTAVEAPRQPIRHFDQIKAMTHVKREVFASLKGLTADQRTTVVIFSGSSKAKLEALFGDMNVWLAAENGVFMQPPSPAGHAPEAWQTLVELPPRIWMESVQLVFDYFCERTPRSFVEARDTSVVWNYRYADAEFGRLQARDLLQHLWTGPISNAPVDIVQGTKSVEVRPVGISKGLAMQRIVAAMADREGPSRVEFDFVMVAGHFLARDENIFTFFEGQGVRTYEASKNMAPLSVTKQVQSPGAIMLPEFLAERGVLADCSGSAPSLPRAASLPAPASPPDSSIIFPSAKLGDAVVLATPRASLDSAAVTRINPQPSSSQASESPSRHRSPTRFAPITYQSDLPPTHPGLQRPRTAPSQAVPISWHERHAQGIHQPLLANHKPGLQQCYASSLGSIQEAMALPLSLPPPHLYTCTIGRKRSQARWLLNGSNDVGSLLARLAHQQQPAPVLDSDSETSLSSIID